MWLDTRESGLGILEATFWGGGHLLIAIGRLPPPLKTPRAHNWAFGHVCRIGFCQFREEGGQVCGVNASGHVHGHLDDQNDDNNNLATMCHSF